jgi:hypothetical protein
MIKDTLFVLRMLAFTVLIVIALQVRVGDLTLDEHFQAWLGRSVFVGYIQEAAHGAMGLAKDGYGRVHQSIVGLLGKYTRKPANEEKKVRGVSVELRRHNHGRDSGQGGLSDLGDGRNYGNGGYGGNGPRAPDALSVEPLEREWKHAPARLREAVQAGRAAGQTPMQ